MSGAKKHINIEKRPGVATPPPPACYRDLSGPSGPKCFCGSVPEKSGGNVVRSEKLQNETSRIFRICLPNILPNFPPNFPRLIRGFFVLCFPRKRRPQKFTKIPALFQCQIPRQIRKKHLRKYFLESRQSKTSWKIMSQQVVLEF